MENQRRAFRAQTNIEATCTLGNIELTGAVYDLSSGGAFFVATEAFDGTRFDSDPYLPDWVESGDTVEITLDGYKGRKAKAVVRWLGESYRNNRIGFGVEFLLPEAKNKDKELDATLNRLAEMMNTVVVEHNAKRALGLTCDHEGLRERMAHGQALLADGLQCVMSSDV